MNNRLDFSFTPNAINYSWRQLALRAGIEDVPQKEADAQYCGVPLYYGFPEQIADKGKKIVVIPCKGRDWAELVGKPAGRIDWVPAQAAFPEAAPLPFDHPIPVIFWGDAARKGKFAECDGDTLVFHVDILATVFFMLSRWEEMDRTHDEEHGRFPASASVAHKQGFLDIPIVDIYGLLLREWFKVIVPGWSPAPSQLRINLTHDIDWIQHYSSVGQFARMAGGALLKRRNLGEFLNQFRHLYVQVTSPARDGYIRSIYDLADQSERHGLFSRFYVMAAEPSEYQEGYDPGTPWLWQCLENLRQRGHEIGIHPGYSTLGNPERLIGEKQRLEKALGESISGGRQHYLRFQVPSTWRHWEQAGLSYDSSLGYSERAGFRCGTCHPYHPFDIELDAEMKIEEIPLIVMDVSLQSYQRLSPAEGKSTILKLARRCAEVGGVFTLLWHNTSFSGEWLEWGRMYPDLLKDLAGMVKR
ncbi:MAG TPA: polysaccharide deacetylase family protein [Anaerolineales bacterium]|nr:polysaccharide deacetylase family protein [Anaerolineales bacterium]